MLNAKLMVGALALAISGSTLAELVVANGSDKELNYRMVDKMVCYDTKISVDDQPVDTSIYARLQDVRGEEVQLQIKDIKVRAPNIAAPKVLVMDSVAYSNDEIVWAKNKGWYVCQ